MGKILFLLAVVAFIFFYYSKPVSIQPQEEPAEQKASVQQEEPAKQVKIKKVARVIKQEPTPEKQIPQEISPEVAPKDPLPEVAQEDPLPELSPLITAAAHHPYADPDKYPLHYAICKEDLEQVKQVLKKETLINEQGEVVLGTKECYCQENKYEICSCDATLTMPPLNLAVLKGNEDIIKYLLRKKANPLTKDEMGKNALDIAQQENMTTLQNLLIKYVK